MRTVHRWTIALAALALGTVVVRPARAQTSVNGVAYAQYGYTLSKDTLSGDSSLGGRLNNFDVTRAYINVNGRFAGGIATRVTADIYSTGSAGGGHGFRLKYAYVAWTPDSSPLTFKLGATQTPLLDWEEALWDYRMQGAMPMERGGYVSSSDFGLAVEGKFNADRFNFQAGLYNGENYSTTTLGDAHKDLMARASYRVMETNDGSRVGGLRLTGYAQYGMPNSGGQRQRFLGMVSYRTMDVTLAAEYAMTKDSVTGGNTTVGGGATAPVASRSGRVASVYGTFHPTGTRITVIGRVDMIDPNTASAASGDRLTRLIAGVAYQLAPNLRLLADYDGLSYESGFTPTGANYAAYATRQQLFLHAMFTF